MVFVGRRAILSHFAAYYDYSTEISSAVNKFSRNYTLFLSLTSLKVANESSKHLHPVLINISAFYQFRYILIGVFFALHRQYIQMKLSGLSVGLPLTLIIIIIAINLIKISLIIGLFLAAAEPIVYGFLVLWVVANPVKCAMLRWGWVQWVGASSYNIYLWQQLFTGKVHFYNGWTISTSPLSLIAIFVCATLSYYLIERPSLRLSKSIFNKKLP